MSNQTVVSNAATNPVTKPTTDGAVKPGLSSRAVLLQTGGAFLFGAIVLLVLGFAPLATVHNAAHDTRHSVVMPCH